MCLCRGQWQFHLPSDITWGPHSKVGLWITTLLGGLEPEFVLVIASTLVMESVPFKSGKSADKESSGPSSSKVLRVWILILLLFPLPVKGPIVLGVLVFVPPKPVVGNTELGR